MHLFFYGQFRASKGCRCCIWMNVSSGVNSLYRQQQQIHTTMSKEVTTPKGNAQPKKKNQPRAKLQLTPQEDRIRHLVCALLDVHPVEQKILAKKHNLCPTVISNYRAGKRRFPLAACAHFFAEIGLTAGGQFLPEYAYGINLNIWNESSALKALETLFPRGGKFSVIQHFTLSCTSVAITDGSIYAVLHDQRGIHEVADQPYPAVQWLENISHMWTQAEPAWISNAILMTNRVPLIDDVRSVFEDALEYDPSFMNDPKWEDVKKQVLKLNMTPRQLLDYLKSLPTLSENDNW